MIIGKIINFLKVKPFKNIIDKTGNLPIEDIINILYHSEMYIGVSSGLAWLSWSIKNPVILISGFSFRLDRIYFKC